MKRLIPTLCLLAGPALAGDSTTPGPVELLVPTVIEVADLGPYVPGMALSLVGGGWTDDQLRVFVFDGPPLPAEVPLPAAGWLLAVALAAMAGVGAGRSAVPPPAPPEPSCAVSPLAPLVSPRPKPRPLAPFVSPRPKPRPDAK